MMNGAFQKLAEAQSRTRSLLSIGLEPCADYLFPGMSAGIDGYRAYLRTIIGATSNLCCAYKFNIAFFEALGAEGMDLLYEIRSHLPDDVLIIMDAKRGDIGSTALRYAQTYYDQLQVDAVTINPLMGRDSAESFLNYTDKLNIFLGLTSNPGAADFLVPNKLYLEIARAVESWNVAGNCALVVGATKADYVGEIRAAAPSLPFLIPGVGAQGGEIEATARAGRMAGDFSGMIFHVTRGILPRKGDTSDPHEIVRQKTSFWNDRVREALQAI